MDKFRDWVTQKGGPGVVARLMGKNQTAVEHWVRGYSHPKLKDVPKLLKLSNGKLTLEDILNTSKVGRWPKARK